DRGLATLNASSQDEGLNKIFQLLKAKGTLIRHTGGGLRISIGTAEENQRTLSNLQDVLGEA
ncbi:MAG: histidinol-phosphate aminotransferase, partial [Cyanobacteria bacterium J06576_12]